MKTKISRQINYFNEALILASKAFSQMDGGDDGGLIDYGAINIVKSEFDEKNKDIIEYFEAVRLDSMSIVNEYKDLSDLFRQSENNPEIFNVLIYSKLKKSIRDYSRKGFMEHIKSALISNVSVRTGERIDEDDIDYLTLMEKLYIFDNLQKYALLKLLNNTSGSMDRLFEMVGSLEDILKKRFAIIEHKYEELREKLKDMDVFEQKELSSVKNQPIFSDIKECEVYLNINFSSAVSLSVTGEEKNLKAIVFIGLLPLLLKDYTSDLHEKKDDIQKRLSTLSDPTRFNVLYLLSQEKVFGKEISERLDISKGTVSYHLNALVEEGLVQMEIIGKKVYYSLNKKGFEEVIAFLNSMIGEKNG